MDSEEGVEIRDFTIFLIKDNENVQKNSLSFGKQFSKGAKGPSGPERREIRAKDEGMNDGPAP